MIPLAFRSINVITFMHKYYLHAFEASIYYLSCWCSIVTSAEANLFFERLNTFLK